MADAYGKQADRVAKSPLRGNAGGGLTLPSYSDDSHLTGLAQAAQARYADTHAQAAEETSKNVSEVWSWLKTKIDPSTSDLGNVFRLLSNLLSSSAGSSAAAAATGIFSNPSSSGNGISPDQLP